MAVCDDLLTPNALCGELHTMGCMEDGQLVGKFVVARSDGKYDAQARYFTLNYAADPYARGAMLTYADLCEPTHPVLAQELRAMVAYHDERDGQRRRDSSKPKRGTIASGAKTASAADLAALLQQHTDADEFIDALLSLDGVRERLALEARD